jgi:hypothetical protein
MSDPGSLTLGAVAWLFAGALAAAAGGVLFALSARRRARSSESQVAVVEGAAVELCDAVRGRIDAEVERARQVLEGLRC